MQKPTNCVVGLNLRYFKGLIMSMRKPKPEINRYDSLDKLWGGRKKFETVDMIDILGGYDGLGVTMGGYDVLGRINDFIWVRDKLQDQGIGVDDIALAYLIFGGKKQTIAPEDL